MSHKEHGLVNHSFTFTHKHYGDRPVITTLLTIHKFMCVELSKKKESQQELAFTLSLEIVKQQTPTT